MTSLKEIISLRASQARTLVQSAGALAFALFLIGCEGPFEPGVVSVPGPDSFQVEPGQVIPPQWIRVTTFQVVGQPDLDANLEVAVQGMRRANGDTECEIIQNHSRFRKDRKWSPLPIAFYSPYYKSPDGSEDLNKVFGQTLDFFNKTAAIEELNFLVNFTRGKVTESDGRTYYKTFSSRWKIYPLLGELDGKPVCTAHASVDRSSQVGCKGNECIIHSIIADPDEFSTGLQYWKSERDIDDLEKLTLVLQEMDSDGFRSGGTYKVDVPGFTLKR